MLERIDEGLWEVPGRVKIMPAFYLPCRMTIVRLEDGRLLLHSPVELDAETAEAIEELGDVGYLVAPNAWHHLFLKDARAHFPGAQMWCAPGLEEKRGDLTFEGVLGKSESLWRSQMQSLLLEGTPDISEVVFFHEATGTLVCTDVVFNLQEFEGWLTPWMCRMFGTYQQFAHSRLWRTKYEDIEAFAASVHRMCQWPIERIVMAHGAIVEERCPQKLEEAFSWLFEQAPTDGIRSPSRQSTA
jgi:hypothetical protein